MATRCSAFISWCSFTPIHTFNERNCATKWKNGSNFSTGGVKHTILCGHMVPSSGEKTGVNLHSRNGSTSTEDVFAIDAGRDLFFRGMDDNMAIELLEKPFGEVCEIEDRFIAAERLKFFPSERSTRAIVQFVNRFDRSKLDDYILEDRIARRKAVETLGRHKGKFLRDEVINLLTRHLDDADSYLVENAVWSLGEIGGNLGTQVLEKVTCVLDNDNIESRVVIQTLLRARYSPALPQLRKLLDSDNSGVRTAAMAAVATLSGDDSVMQPIIGVLQSDDLNIRRYAIEDIKLAGYVSALDKVATCPNSLVLRARTVRSLLDKRREEDGASGDILDDDTARLVDRLIWDHPGDLDLLGMKKETRRSRDISRNVQQLYKNDALHNYLACRTLAEDHQGSESDEAAAAVLKSYNDLDYFDYFGAYHVYKTLGWLRYNVAFDLLLESATTLPPRFFNHQAGAVTALAELGRKEALTAITKIASGTTIWELKYACLIASERLGDSGHLRQVLSGDSDWLIRARCANEMGMGHLRNTFVTQ